MLGPQHDPRRALREQIIQNVIADLGYPAPRVRSASADLSTLGGGFLVMERLPGQPLLAAHRVGIASVLVQSQVRLHGLDARRLLEAMDAAGERDAVTFDGLLAQLRLRVDRRRLGRLQEAVEWLTEHRPAVGRDVVICHGDFHPQNILISAGAVTGVLDWPNAVVADPAYDVASTRIILSLVPTSLLTMPSALRGLVRLVRPLLLARYLAGYRRHRPIDPRALAYYEAASCMRHLVRVTEGRLGAVAGTAPLDPLDASAFGERVCARFARITGITPSVPPVPGALSQ